MSSSFVNSKQVKVFLADVIDSMPYLKASKSYFANQMKGKKGGKDYYFTLRDAGNPSKGLSIGSNENGDVEEKQVKVHLENYKTFVDLDVLQEVVDIEDFKTEIADTFGVRLGAQIQKDVIGDTMLDASVVNVDSGSTNGGWVALAKSIAHLKSARNGAKVVGFIDPVAESNLTVDAMNGWHFGPSEKGNDFYGDASIGKFQGAEFVYCTDMPMINIGASAVSGTISSISESDGETTLTLSTAMSLKKGTPLKLANAKACNSVGMPTNADFYAVVLEDTSAATSAKVGRIECKDIGSRNCYISGVSANDAFSNVTFTCPLTTGTDYYIGNVRVNDVLAVEDVPMADLAGAETNTQSVGGLSLKWTKFGDVDGMTNRSRADVCLGAKIVDNRLNCLAFIKA